MDLFLYENSIVRAALVCVGLQQTKFNFSICLWFFSIWRWSGLLLCTLFVHISLASKLTRPKRQKMFQKKGNNTSKLAQWISFRHPIVWNEDTHTINNIRLFLSNSFSRLCCNALQWTIRLSYVAVLKKIHNIFTLDFFSFNFMLKNKKRKRMWFLILRNKTNEEKNKQEIE